jgi:excisionase family DNA binding protein
MKKTVSQLSEQELRAIIRDEVRAVLKEKIELDVINDDYVDIKKAVEILGISKSTLYKMVGAGKIAYTKQGPKKLLFKKADLQEWLAKSRDQDKVID